jgi:hypothetical protein
MKPAPSRSNRSSPSSPGSMDEIHSPRIYPNLSRLPWKDDVMISYLLQNSREGPVSIVCHRMETSGDQSESLQQTTTKQCLLALATILYGTGHSNESFVQDGRRLYGQALNKITTIISNPTGLQTNDILTSLYVLSLFEVRLPSLINRT